MELHSLPSTRSTTFCNNEDDYHAATNVQASATVSLSSPTNTMLPQPDRSPSREENPHPPERLAEVSAEPAYPTKARLGILTVALMVAVFMIGLDTYIVGTATPKITTRFHSLNDVGWYGSAYLLTQLSFQSTFGKLYTFFNNKWIYMAALLIFEIGSAFCASAPNSKFFILGRAISGVGCAGIYSGSLTIGPRLVPLKQRPLYISIVTSMYGIAAVSGPLLGGVFTGSAVLTWRFCFWINLPFGSLALLIIGTMYRAPKLSYPDMSFKDKIRKMDTIGTILLMSTIVCLLLVLQWAGIKYPWKDSRVWGCLIGFGCLLCLFILVQVRRKEEATIPMRILSQRSIASSCLFVAFVNMAIDTHIYYLPFYFQAVKNTSAEGSGIRMLPYIIAVFLTAVATGTIITIFGRYAPLMWLGASILTVGCGLIHTLRLTSNLGHWFGYEVLTGVGFGMAFQIPYTVVQVVLPKEDLAVGNALIVFFQALGGALAVSIGQNVLSKVLLQELGKFDSRDAASILAAGAANLATNIPAALLGQVKEAYSTALSRTYILPIVSSGFAFFCSLAIERKVIE